MIWVEILFERALSCDFMRLSSRGDVEGSKSRSWSAANVLCLAKMVAVSYKRKFNSRLRPEAIYIGWYLIRKRTKL